MYGVLPGRRFECVAGGVAKDFTALGGKVGSAGPGVEAEEGEGVEVGRDGAKLLTFGVGKVDKDAVLQAGKAQIDSVKTASQQVVLEILDIVGGLGGGGIETPRLGLVKKIVDEMNELAAGLGNFGDHGDEFYMEVRSEFLYGVAMRSHAVGHGAGRSSCKGPPRGEALGDGSVGERRPGFSSGEIPRAAAAGFFVVDRLGMEVGEGIGRVVMRSGVRRSASDRSGAGSVAGC